ncbi:MAG: hypothetical protein ACYTG6_10585 [Planctomycetota bacterium]|jgi:glyoxylase-like metal-dependent hydrolase (beta-lactamase superfamily II)
MDLEVETVVVGPFQQNCRIVKDRRSGHAVIIDPGDEPDRILAVVERSQAKVSARRTVRPPSRRLPAAPTVA